MRNAECGMRKGGRDTEVSSECCKGSALSRPASYARKGRFAHSASRSRGFTLIEVLVALAIFGVIAVSLLNTMQGSVRQQAVMEERLSANLVAQQALAEVRMRSSWPPVGEKTQRVPLGAREWQVTARVENTSEERMRHITVEVARPDEENPVLTLDAWTAREGESK